MKFSQRVTLHYFLHLTEHNYFTVTSQRLMATSTFIESREHIPQTRVSKHQQKFAPWKEFHVQCDVSSVWKVPTKIGKI